MILSGKHTIIDGSRLPRDEETLHRELRGFVDTFVEENMSQRSAAEFQWRLAWAQYFGTPEAQRELRSQVLTSVGNVSADWRHRINVGKAYEIVEAVVGHLMSAFFPNRNWLGVETHEPTHTTMAVLLRKFIALKLDKACFESHWESFLRQMVICGPSVISLPWKGENFKFRILDNFDCYFTLDGDDNDDPLTFVRRTVMYRHELLRGVREGRFAMTEMEALMLGGDTHVHTRGNKNLITEFNGLHLETPTSLDDKLYVFETWGEVVLESVVYHNKRLVTCGEKVLEFEENPYKCGLPFVVGTFTPVIKQPIGLSGLSPVLSIIHMMSLMTNQRADSLELIINNMWTLRTGGVLKPEEVKSRPGAVFMVNNHDDLQPVRVDPVPAQLASQDIASLGQAADKIAGTGPLVGGGQVRAAERVTAQEVQAVQEAGGNKLTTTFSHINRTSFSRVLHRVTVCLRQFVDRDEVIQLPSMTPGLMEYYEFGVRELRGLNFSLKVLGAEHIVAEKQKVDTLIQLVSMSATVPQFAEKINYDTVFLDILTSLGLEYPERYIAQPQQPAADPLARMGGAPLKNAAIKDVAATGGNQLLSILSGGKGVPPGMTLEQLMETMTNADDTVRRATSGSAGRRGSDTATSDAIS